MGKVSKKEKTEAVKKNPKDAKGHLGYHKFIFDKGLPEYWEEVYRLNYKRLKRYYWKEKYITNPIMAICIERIAYLNTQLLFMESDDYKDIYGALLEKQDMMKKHAQLQQMLNKALEQLMKYTEVKVVPNRNITTIKKKEIRSVKDASELSDRELQEQIRERLQSVEVTLRRETTEEQSSQLGEGLHREIPVDKR